MIVDANFAIAVERETRLRLRGRATRFLEAHVHETLYLPFTVAGELACGRSASDYEKWQELCRAYVMLEWSPRISWRYGEIYRHLRAQGKIIGTNDLWIAATALVHDMPVVTNNVDEFQRVPGLVVISF